MKLSLENEIRLKTLVRSENKENDCIKLLKEIENKENLLMTHVTNEYKNIIKRCDALKTIKNKIPQILDKNENLINKYKESFIEITKIETEIDENIKLDIRIKELIDELSSIEKFIELLNNTIGNTSPYYWFSISKDIKMASNLIPKFSKYYFYDTLNDLYILYKNGIEAHFRNKFYEFQNDLKNKSVGTGQQIIEKVQSYDKTNAKIIFSELSIFREIFINSLILDLFYYKEEIGNLDSFIEFFNLERKKIILGYLSDYTTNNEILYCFTFEILNGYYLQEINKNIIPYHNYILKKMNEILVGKDVEQIMEFKDILVAIKYLLKLLNINDESLIEIIGRISIEFFINSNIKSSAETKGQFKIELNNFIDKGIEFTKKLGSNEINELFVNKIDLNLKSLVNTTTQDTVIQDEKYIQKVIDCINKQLPDISLRSEKEINQKIQEVKRQVIESKLPELEKCINSDKNIELQSFFKENAEFKEQVYEVVKIKFIELINKSKDKPIQTRRTINCKVSCVYKFLEKFDMNLYKDFIRVNDESKKLV